ncbi:MAG: mycofactocin system protein MftB [Frankiales bacterium]|nr:mycofactocin system protein MftB [Frankiales bacterium]
MLTLHPKVSVRPEPFGALLYHFGTRRLSFLKDRRLLDVVRRLDGTVSLDEALADIPPGELASFRSALGTLEQTGMLHHPATPPAPQGPRT